MSGDAETLAEVLREAYRLGYTDRSKERDFDPGLALDLRDALAAHDVAIRAEGVNGEQQRRLAVAIKDVCWRATPYGTTEDGDTFAYIVTKGAMHRLIGAAQGAGISAAFRAAQPTEGEYRAHRPVRTTSRDPLV